VTTPSNNSISNNNKGPNQSTDQGQYDIDISNGTGLDNIFWNNNVRPPIGVYHICVETQSFISSITNDNPVIFIIQVRQPRRAPQVFTKTLTISIDRLNTCDSSKSSFVTSITYQ
jgi:hypothetical protein